MAPVTLPPAFVHSFWSPDYRSGLQVLFNNLEQGCLENDDVAAFIESQAKGHDALARTLLNPPLPSTPNSQSSSLQHSLLQLRGASSARGEAHQALARELEERVLSGFQQWKDRHEDRITSAKEEMLAKSGVVGVWEKDVHRLIALKQTYLTKSRIADDSEDDAKFAPATASVQTSCNPTVDNYTSSPKPKHAQLKRTGTVADRISEKLRAASVSSHKPSLSVEGKILPAPPTPLRPSTPVNGAASPSSPTREEAFIPPSDPSGKPTIHSANAPPPPPKTESPLSASPELPPQPILLSGLSLLPKGLKDLLQKFDAHILTHPAPYSDASTTTSRSNAALASRQRTTILGTYEKTFSGEEVVSWLRENVEGFGGDWERCVEAAGELHRMGYFSRIGVGRGFEASYDTYFVLKVNPQETPLSSFASPLSPTKAQMPAMLRNYLPSSLGQSDEPAHVRARRDAVKAEEAYREGIRQAEDKRLEMEERIERGLRIWERWERERLGILGQVMQQYQEALSRLPGRLADLSSSTALSVEAFNPEADIKALIEGNRTGPFRPRPHVYESVESDIPEVNFGVDLRRWSGDLGWKSMLSAPSRPKGSIPEVLTALLSALNEMYAELDDDDEKRKSWIYEVPLHETHQLRNVINSPRMTVAEMIDTIKKFNVPIAAGTVKLYLLELSPPVMTWEGWEDAKAVYPSVGADQERDVTSALTSVISRLPGAHLFVLDAVVKHLRELIDDTKTDESNEIYVTKLALSVGRTVLRPQYESDVTIQDRTPSLFLADLINSYQAVFPPLIEKRKSESDRPMPVRKRTALVDQRISRSRLSGGGVDAHEMLEAQYTSQKRASSPTPDAKPSPTIVTSSSGPPQLGNSILGLGEPVAPPGGVDEVKTPINEVNESIKLIPPTPAQHEEPVIPEQPQALAAQEDDGVESPTAAYLQSMEAGPGEEPVATGGASVKRATSGEVSRLRGPRGARGPRPAPGRTTSHSGHPDELNRTRSPTPTHGEGAGLAGPRRSGAIRHGAKGSVSQAIARFENTE